MKAKKTLSAVLSFFVLIYILSAGFGAYAQSERCIYRSSYMYDILETNEDRELYDNLEAACEMVDNSYEYCYSIDVLMPIGMSRENAEEIINIFIYDNPQYFWLSSAYTIKRMMFIDHVRLYVLDYFMDGDIRQTTKVKVFKAVDEYVNEAMKLNTPYEKVLYLNNVLLKNVKYQMGDWDQTIASVYLQKETVCAGYSKAFELMCNLMGIDAILVTSKNHAWNMVKLYGYWFIVDVTNNSSMKYFLISDKKMAELDKYNDAVYRHRIDKGAYIKYYDKFPKCPYSYSDLPDDIPDRPKLAGDANSDGVVDIRDAAYIAIYLSRGMKDNLPETSDFNMDGVVDIRDAAAIAMALAEIR